MCHGVEMSIVAVTRPLPAPGIAPLESAGVEVRTTSIDRPIARDELLELVDGADALLCLLTDRIDAEVFDRSPGLRVVANYAVGYDNIDVAEATRRGIVVTNTPGALTDASADLAFALLLAAARNLGEGERLVRADAWTGWAPSQLLGQAVAGRTLGIVGMGAIGTAVAVLYITELIATRYGLGYYIYYEGSTLLNYPAMYAGAAFPPIPDQCRIPEAVSTGAWSC